MFYGINFMHETKPLLESTKLGLFKFFTVDSNMLAGIISCLFIIQEIKLLKGKVKNIPSILYKLKLAGTTAVSITFIITFGYLRFIAEGGIKSLLMNSNLFYHLITPVLCIITFIFFEKTEKLKLKDTIYGLIPTVLYSIFYTTNVCIHMSNFKVSPKYDWYYFAQQGVFNTIITSLIILITTYIVSILLWKLNKEK